MRWWTKSSWSSSLSLIWGIHYYKSKVALFSRGDICLDWSCRCRGTVSSCLVLSFAPLCWAPVLSAPLSTSKQMMLHWLQFWTQKKATEDRRVPGIPYTPVRWFIFKESAWRWSLWTTTKNVARVRCKMVIVTPVKDNNGKFKDREGVPPRTTKNVARCCRLAMMTIVKSNSGKLKDRGGVPGSHLQDLWRRASWSCTRSRWLSPQPDL